MKFDPTANNQMLQNAEKDKYYHALCMKFDI